MSRTLGLWMGFIAITGSAVAGDPTPAIPRSVPVVVDGQPISIGTRDGRVLTAAAVSRLAALNARADAPFSGHVSLLADRVGTISGGRIWLGSREETPALFFAEFGPVFGLDSALQPRVRWISDRAHVSFLYQGVEIADVRAILVFDHDDVVGARFDLPKVAQALGGFDLPEADAIERGRAAADAERAARTAPPVVWTTSQAQRRFVATDAGLVPTWQVEIRTDRKAPDYDGKAIFVDARNGQVVRSTDRVDHGDGFYPFQGQKVLFKTTNKGKGKVYKTVKAALTNKPSNVKLTDLATNIPQPVNLGFGFLVGAFVDSWDANAFDTQSVTGKFQFDPFGFQFNNFDQTNTYFQLTAVGNKLQKDLGKKIATNFALPVITNFQADSVNAFFSPDPFPIDNHTNGFILIHDLANVGFGPAGDVGRDAAVVAHEYTHAWLSFEGLGFQGPKNGPARGFNEGIADAYSLFHHGDTVIGRYMKATFSQAFGQDFSRDLQDQDRFPQTTLDAKTLTQDGLPEEHRNGEIAGSFLMDIKKSVGVLKAKRLIYAGLPFTPGTEADVSPAYAQITAQNSVAATEDFDFACVAGILQGAPIVDRNTVGAVIGAATARGIIGSPTSFNSLAADLEAFPGRKLTFKSHFVLPGDQHIYFFHCQPGRTLKISLTALKGSKVNPNFALIGVNPAFDPFATFTNPKKVGKGAKSVTQSGIHTLLPATELYMVTVAATNFLAGDYQLVLDA